MVMYFPFLSTTCTSVTNRDFRTGYSTKTLDFASFLPFFAEVFIYEPRIEYGALDSGHCSENLQKMLKIEGFSQSGFRFGNNYALECFSEAGSAPIRSARRFYFDLDVQKISQLFQKKFFGRLKKNINIFGKIYENF